MDFIIFVEIGFTAAGQFDIPHPLAEAGTEAKSVPDGLIGSATAATIGRLA